MVRDKFFLGCKVPTDIKKVSGNEYFFLIRTDRFSDTCSNQPALTPRGMTVILWGGIFAHLESSFLEYSEIVMMASAQPMALSHKVFFKLLSSLRDHSGCDNGKASISVATIGDVLQRGM